MIKSVLKSIGRHGRSVSLLSPLAGTVIPLEDVNDQTFAAGLLGQGVAIVPSGNEVVAPADCKISAIFPTGHAVALKTNNGLDVLIHVGLETVKLDGRHFSVHVAVGDEVSQGQKIIGFDREAISSEGFDVTAPIIICNSVEFSSIKGVIGSDVAELDQLIVAKER